jgi:hypothetical protein
VPIHGVISICEASAMQFSLFGAAVAEPTLGDLDGVLLAGGHWVRSGALARLSVVVDAEWRAVTLADAFGGLGVGETAQPIVAAEGGLGSAPPSLPNSSRTPPAGPAERTRVCLRDCSLPQAACGCGASLVAEPTKPATCSAPTNPTMPPIEPPARSCPGWVSRRCP